MFPLTIQLLCDEVERFSRSECEHHEKTLYGVTDGKKIGTYLEHKFRKYLQEAGYSFEAGNSGSGIDFPDLEVDIKATSIRQPQSSCPYRNARQKIYGLGYSLVIFVYDKVDNPKQRTGNLNVLHTIFVEKERTADFQMTRGLREILDNEGNEDDIMAFISDKNLPVDSIELNKLVKEVMTNRPEQGYLTISNALQWRLNYSRVIEKAGDVPGIRALYSGTSNE